MHRPPSSPSIPLVALETGSGRLHEPASEPEPVNRFSSAIPDGERILAPATIISRRIVILFEYLRIILVVFRLGSSLLLIFFECLIAKTVYGKSEGIKIFYKLI